jgi:ABC-type nitrate/sulfonate/bicarbonate transport system substrate-binding protein
MTTTRIGMLAALVSALCLACCAGGSSGTRAPASPKSTTAPAAPPPLQTVNLIVFPGGFNWPIWVARDKGFFAQQGIEVRITPTPSSVFQLTNLIDGKFDIAMTAIDNLIAYREGQGEVPKEGPDLFAFMGGDNGFLRLVTVPEVKSYRDLRGKTLSVDAMTTGYAFVLFEMMAKNKMAMNRDYKVVTAGGVLQRFQALMEKKHAGTLLLSPFEVQAEEKGFHRLGNATDVIGRYQGLVGGARKSWAEKNQSAVIGYIRAFSDAVDWLYNPANRDEAIAIFLKNLPNATPQGALVAYGILLSPADGFQKKAKIDLEGVKTVLALRTKYAKPQKVLKDPALYYDSSFYDAAMFK